MSFGSGASVYSGLFLIAVLPNSAPKNSTAQLIHLEEMNYPTRLAAELIRAQAVAISEFEGTNRGVLSLRRR
jgi:hypothetical protein